MEGWKSTLAVVLTIIQWSGVLLMLGGQTIFDTLNLDVPGFVQPLMENKMVLLAVFFIAGQLASRMSASGMRCCARCFTAACPHALSSFSTGAFEIYLDGQEIHSKLATGGVPHIGSLIQQLRGAGLPTYEDVEALSS